MGTNVREGVVVILVVLGFMLYIYERFVALPMCETSLKGNIYDSGIPANGVIRIEIWGMTEMVHTGTYPVNNGTYDFMMVFRCDDNVDHGAALWFNETQLLFTGLPYVGINVTRVVT